MDINSLFFSERNIEKLSSKLANNLKLKNDPKTMANCRQFVKIQMKEILKKFGKQRPRGLSIPEFVDKLSEKALDDCIKMYKIQRKKTSQSQQTANYQAQQTGNYQMDREAELHRGQQRGIPKRPQYTSGIKNNSEFPGLMDSMQGAGSNFAPLSSIVGNGAYTRADGTMGTAEDWNKPSESSGYGAGKGNPEDLQRRVLQRQQEYDQKNNFQGGNMDLMQMGNSMGYGMDMMNNPMVGMGVNPMSGMGVNPMSGMGMNPMSGMGMNPMAENMQHVYNPNPYGKQKPPDINFALDGGDTRGSSMRHREEQKKMQEMMSQMGDFNIGSMSMNDPSFGMGGMNMSEFDPSMSNLMMGNPIMENPMMNNQMMGNQMMNNSIMSNPMMGSQMGQMGQMGQMNQMNNSMMSQMGQMMSNPITNQLSNQMNNQSNNSYNINQNSYMDQNNIGRLNDQDFLSKMSQIKQERTQNDNSIKYNPKNFNPMMSPNISNQQYQQMLNQNFIKGGRVGASDFQNMKSEDLQKYINERGNSILQNCGIDLKKIKSMSLEKLKEMKNKLKEEIDIDEEDKNDPDSISNNNELDSKSESESELKLDHKELLSDILKKDKEIDKDKIIDLIKMIKQNKKNLDNITVPNIKPTIDKINTKNNITIENEENILSDNSDSEEYVNKSIVLNFDSEESVEPRFYSDYILDFPENLNNVIITSLEITNIELPQERNKITNDCNKFIFIIDEQENEMELDEGEYNIKQIFELLESGFKELNLKMKIYSRNNRVVIEHKKKKLFKLKNDEGSVLKKLGFTQSYYESEFIYESELSHSFFDTIYMYVYYNLDNNQMNIFEDKPFTDLKGKINKSYKKKLNASITNTIGYFFIKFKNSISENEDEDEDEDGNNLYNFVNEPHKYTIKIQYKEENKKLNKKSNNKLKNKRIVI